MKRNPESSLPPLVVGDTDWTIEDIVSIADTQRDVQLSDAPSWRARIQKGAQFLEQLWKKEGIIYGVTTGYGASCEVSIPTELVETLPLHLTRFHGCGMGTILAPSTTRAVLAVRLRSISKGFSGVRLELLEQLVGLINHNIIPFIPEEGSVGASGDLTPLSYVAAALMGERDVLYKEKRVSARSALEDAGLPLLTLQPKEGLAIMNGTAMMTALACQAYHRASYLARLASRITALSAITLQSNLGHFDERLFRVKPFQGQAQVARWIREDLGEVTHEPQRLQERYSIRCAPHFLGVLVDALPWMREQIEIELNSTNDNPIIDVDNELILHGGHFYGGHIAFVMDSLKNAVSHIADGLDRQMALMVDPHTNQGLPSNLSGSTGLRSTINHGFKAVQIGASAWTAEALKLTMPASVFSRSTECHNQDKVSLGTIAARDALRILQLTEQVAAAVLLCAHQGFRLRERLGQCERQLLPSNMNRFLTDLEEFFPFLEEDRPLEQTLRFVTESIQAQRWSL